MSDTGRMTVDRPVANNEFAAALERFPRHDFARYHEEVLPGLLRARTALFIEEIAALAPLAFVVDGDSYTYLPALDRIELCAGAEGASTVVELSAQAFSDLVNEVHSVSGLAIGGKLIFRSGDLASFHRWEPALRAAYSGRPIWTPAAAEKLVDAAGRRLDLSRTFELSDADEEMRAYLQVAGFVHIKHVFEKDEVQTLGAELDRVRAALTTGDGDCWWSSTADGRQVVTRINYLDRWSAMLRDTGFDARVTRLGRLLGSHYRYCDDRLDGPMAFIKNSNVTQGLGDLLWHQDDGLGGHPILCPLMQVGVQLDVANSENGQLWVLAGSHEYTNHPMQWGEESGKPVVRLVTEPGDVTVHFGDIFHTTPPPTGVNAGRRVLYFKFAEPKTFEIIPAGAHYNDILFKKGVDDRVAVRARTWSEDDTQAGFERKMTNQ